LHTRSFFKLLYPHQHPVLSPADVLAAEIDGRHRAAVTLQENTTHWFNCQSGGWDPRAPPLLTWYLNGRRQLPLPPSHRRPPPVRMMGMTTPPPPPPRGGSEAGGAQANRNSTFSLRARKWDRELVCVASNSRTGETHNATVTLNVQCECVCVCVSVCERERNVSILRDAPC